MMKRACFVVAMEDTSMEGMMDGQGWTWSGQSLPTCVRLNSVLFFCFFLDGE
jgi:hypothetical protein